VIQRRLAAWKDLAASPKYKSAGEPDKLKAVNDFIHETPFYCDPVLWCKEDYWAKPVEFIVHTVAGGGTDTFARVVAEIITRDSTRAMPTKPRLR